MIAKVFLFLCVVAAARSTLLGSGIVAPGLLNAGILAPGLGIKGAPLVAAPIASAVNTASVVAIPGAVSTDRRIIGTAGLLTAAPIANGLIAHGLLGAAPLAWGNGLVSPLGIKGAGLLAAPGIVKTVL